MQPSGKNQRKKKTAEVKTYSVPFSPAQIKENISINTNTSSKPSKEQIINQAFNYHAKGNISEAAKYYQSFIDQGFRDHRVFANYGNILRDSGKLEKAENLYRKAIEINPDYFIAHYNLGNIFINLGKLDEAELSTRKAIELNPNSAEAHLNLGTILNNTGKLQEAEYSYRKAIEENPNYADAHYNLANTLNDNGRSEEAMIHRIKAVELKPQDDKLVQDLAENLCYKKKYQLALKYLTKNESNSCQSIYLSCLLSLDREKDFNKKYKELYDKKICNAEIGGVVEHANIIYKKQYKSNFCNNSIKYIFTEKINEKSFSKDHLNQLISFNKTSKKENRSQDLLKNGIQTSGNLFLLDFPFIKSIKKAIEAKIELYKYKFRNSAQGFITNWPEEYELRSWMISMKTGGFLAPHNHTYGWITGSFYLQIPKDIKDNDKNAGDIAFSYQGPSYPNKDNNFNLTIKKVETRDIFIFPSSLFHHTIPFKSTEERICFVFDLIQKN